MWPDRDLFKTVIKKKVTGVCSPERNWQLTQISNLFLHIYHQSWFKWSRPVLQKLGLNQVKWEHWKSWHLKLLSVAWPTGVQLLVFFCSSVPVVLFDTLGISRCRSQHVSVESSSLLHHSIYLWFICFTWWSIDELENLHADRTTVCFEPW